MAIQMEKVPDGDIVIVLFFLRPPPLRPLLFMVSNERSLGTPTFSTN